MRVLPNKKRSKRFRKRNILKLLEIIQGTLPNNNNQK